MTAGVSAGVMPEIVGRELAGVDWAVGLGQMAEIWVVLGDRTGGRAH